MDAESIDPRDASGLISNPDYRVDFWETPSYCDTWRVRGAADVSQVLAWAEQRKQQGSYVIYAEHRDGPQADLTLVRLLGNDPGVE